MTAQNEPVGPRPLRAVPDDGYTDWEAVYQDNATWVYRTLFARVGNRADAEDLTTEVFLAALRPLRLTASVGEVRAYLRATARTVLAAHWRETMGREITSIDDIEQPPDSEEAISTAPQRVAHVLDSCRTAIAGFWNCVSCKVIRSRSRLRNSGSALPTPKCSNIALCDWRHRSTMGASHERARVAPLRRRSAAGSPAQAVCARRLRGRADPHGDRAAGGSAGP